MNAEQKFLFEELKIVDEILTKNGIRYFLGGGSALGAIRNGGFLPWDDDIDLYITRDEWKKAKPALERELPERYALLDNENYPLYNSPIFRVVDTRTATFFRSRVADGTPHGIPVDILLLDPVPSAKAEFEAYYKKFWLYCECLATNFVVANPGLDGSLLDEDLYREYYDLMQKEGRQAVLDRLGQEVFSYPEDSCEEYHLRWGVQCLKFPKRAFREQLIVDFEGIRLPVAKGFADMLFGNFGDTWMIVPKGEEQITHPTIGSHVIPYSEYEHCFEKELGFYNKPEQRLKYKELNIDIYFRQDSIRRECGHLEARRVAMKFDKLDLTEQLAAGDHAAIDRLLAEYYSAQRRAFKTFQIIPVNEDVIYAALATRLYYGDLDFVQKLKAVKSDFSSEKINEIMSDLKAVREIDYAKYYGTCDRYGDRAAELLKKYPGQINLLEVVHSLKATAETVDKAAEIRELEALEELHPGRPYITMLKGDLLLDMGEKDTALKVYRGLIERSRDGMVNQMVKRRLV